MFCRSPQTLYKLKSSDIDVYFNNIRLLSDQVSIWPQPQELMFGGEKLPLLDDLSSIHEDDDCYPFHTPIDNVAEFASNPANSGKVIKRSFSDCGNHVVHLKNKDATRKLSKLLKDEDRRYSPMACISPSWFVMPFIPELISKGELRTFCIGGVPIYTVLTAPLVQVGENVLDVHPAFHITPLSVLAKNRDDICPSRPTHQLANAPLSLALHEKGDREFYNFVSSTLRSLVEREERRCRRKSGLQTFCRMDVSVYLNKSDEYQFFVNEVGRSHCLSMFGSLSLPATREAYLKLIQTLGVIHCKGGV